jgi:hypothetical protein
MADAGSTARPPATGGRRTVPLWKQRPFQIGAAVVAALAAGGVALALAGGGGGEEAGPTTVAGSTTAASTTRPEEPVIAPLTGLPDEEGVTRDRSALLVKIDNIFLAVRPDQSGIDLADVVFEEPVEGATRLHAVFHSRTPELIGPVRSTRLIDAAIATQFGSVPYVYSGGTDETVGAIDATPVQALDETALVGLGASVRDPNIERPHNLFVIPGPVWDADDDHAPPDPLFVYLREGRRFQGSPVARIEIPTFSRAAYTWDDASGTWKREQLRTSGSIEPHLAASGEQVAPANVIVQRIDGALRQESLLGEGDAWVFSQGRMARARWARESLDSRTVYRGEGGTEIELTPGTTWVTFITDGEPVVSLPAERTAASG